MNRQFKQLLWASALLVFVQAPILRAAEIVKIDRVKRDKGHLYVERQWVKANPCITVTFRPTVDMESDNLQCRAYFFDKKKEVLQTLQEYTSWSTGAGDLVRLPHDLKAGDPYEIYFGIPNRFKNDWHRVVLVFEKKGDVKSRVVSIYPTDTLSDYPIPN